MGKMKSPMRLAEELFEGYTNGNIGDTRDAIHQPRMPVRYRVKVVMELTRLVIESGEGEYERFYRLMGNN